MANMPFERIAGRYDLLNDVLSWGMHRRWKSRLITSVLSLRKARSRRILDVATGTGDLVHGFLRRGADTDGEVLGLDPSQAMLDVATRRMPTARWVKAPSENLPVESTTVGVITCAFGVRNFADRAAAFREWYRVLAPGGVVGVLEIHPIDRGLLRRPMEFYWQSLVPLVGKMFGDQDAYLYLRDTAARFVTPTELCGEISATGLRLVSCQSLFACGIVNLSLFRKDEDA